MKSLRHLQIALFFGLGLLLLWHHAGAPRLGGAPAQAAARPFVTCAWNTGVGDWNDTTKWTTCGGGVPGANDTAVINGGTVTVSTPVTVGTLQLNMGTLTGGGTLTVNNSMTWAGGIMSGAGVTAIAAGGTLDLTANSTTLDGRILSNAGTTTLSNPFSLTLSNQAVFNNQAGAVFNLQSDANILISGTQPNVFNNFGTVRKTSGIGNSIFTVFNNQNLVEVQAGYISLTGGGACSGPLNVSTGATFVFNSGSYTLNTGAALNGTGTYQLNNATLTVEGNVVCAPAFTHNGGTLNGVGTFTANSSYSWAGGWMSGSGSTTIAAGATLNLPTAAFKALDGRTLNNAGTTNLSGTGGLSLQNQAVFNNQAGALFAVQSNAGISGGTFNNSGIWRKTVSGDTQIITVFNNSGSFDLQAGPVTLSGGGASNGTMIVGNGVTLMFGNNYTLNTGAMLTGAGAYHLNSNFTLSVAGNVVCAATFNQSNGTLSGPGTFTASNVYNWSGGRMVGGITLIPAGATLNLTGSNLKSLEGHTLNNAGTTNLSGTGALFESNQAVFNNQAGALFDVQSDADINLAGNGNFTNIFNNAGIFRKSGAGDTIVGPAFNNSNQVQLLAGSVQFFQFTQTAGSTLLNGGALSFGPTGQLQGGVLGGNGTITGILNHSGGTISPGLSPGALTIIGTYTQGPNATLNIELGGTTAGTQYDRLAVTGAATLAGALNVTTINGFVPAASNNFTVATFASRTGVFGALNLPNGLNAFHTPINVVLGSCPANTITPATLPNGTAGTNYNQALTVAGGAGGTAFSIASGALPSGITLSQAGLLSGVPPLTGQFNFTVRAIDPSGCLGELAYTLTISPPCPTNTITPATLPNGYAGANYNQSLIVTGGTGGPAFSIASGALPTGITLSSAGVLSGTPIVTGQFNFTVRATDASDCLGERAYTLTIQSPCPTNTITPATLPNGYAGASYNQALTVTGGTGGQTFSIAGGALPSGIVLSQAGLLSGTPTVTGQFNFIVRAINPSGCLGQRAYTLTIQGACPTNTITPATMPNGHVGANYNQPLTVTGGSGGSVFYVPSGVLPPGITFSQAGLLSGTPTVTGQFNFSVRAIDPSGCLGERSYTLTINGPCAAITVNPATLPDGQSGVQYSQTFTQTGGAGAATFAITAGALPNGLSLATGGALTGAPTAFGEFSFTVTATDANGCTGARAYLLHVNAPCSNITVNPTTLPDGAVGTAYNQTATATGGTAPYTYTVSSGSLPGGLNLVSGGALTGTPNAAGVFNFTIKATDANDCFGSRAYTMTINGSGGGNNGLQFYPLPRPVRILDTRAGQGNCDNISTPINGGSSLSTFARLTCEGISIPANAQAIVGNVTVLNQTAQTGYMTIYPDGQNPPLVANMIYGPNGILANNFTVGLGANGNFNIFGEKTIDAVVDISGYYAPPAAGGLYYHPLSKPIRLLDTRAGQGDCDNVNAPIAAGTSITTLARTTCQGLTIPQAAQAIVGIATVINVSGQVGYLTIYPNGVPAPLAANMVYFPGQLLSNAFTVSLSANGEFNIFGERRIDMGIDVAGYYSTEANDANGAGLLFTPLATPVRLLDTRAGQGNCDSVNAPITSGTSLTKMARMTCEGQLIPNNAQAVIGNVTVINQTNQAGYITMYPTGQPAPLVANMIYQPSQLLSNAFVVGLNASGQFNIFAERTLEAIVDVSGFFAP